MDARLYRLLRLFVNGVQPVSKRIGAVHVGEHTRRLHDLARTPLNRLLDSGAGLPEALQQIQQELTAVSPLTLKRSIGAHLQGRPQALQSLPGRRWPDLAYA